MTCPTSTTSSEAAQISLKNRLSSHSGLVLCHRTLVIWVCSPTRTCIAHVAKASGIDPGMSAVRQLLTYLCLQTVAL